MAILLHEIGHVLHLWTSSTPIYAEKTHGKDWMNKVKETMIRVGLKKCPNPMCNVKRYFKRSIFYQRCKRKAHLEETATVARQN